MMFKFWSPWNPLDSAEKRKTIVLEKREKEIGHLEQFDVVEMM